MRRTLRISFILLLALLLAGCGKNANKLRTPHEAAAQHESFLPLNCTPQSSSCIIGVPVPVGSNPLVIISDALRIKKPQWIDLGEGEYATATKHLTLLASSVPNAPGWWGFTVAHRE